MRITNDYNKTYQPKFGDVNATQRAIKYLNENLSPKQISKANEIIANQKGKKPDINWLTGVFQKPGQNTDMRYFRAQVNDQVFKEGLFTSVFDVIKKSAKYAESLQKNAGKQKV